jgi:tRNA threonylcarbamoyladenosine biosynthesis protein TsaE
LYHIDCYRLEGTADVITAGLEDIIEPDRTLMIEWPERIESLLPEERLWVSLRHVDDTRRGLRI